MTADQSDVKARLAAADRIVDALPWKLGATEAQRKHSRGRVSALSHQIAALPASGWDNDEVHTALGDAEAAPGIPMTAAQAP